MFIAKTVALNKCLIILTKYVACLVSYFVSNFAIMRFFIGSPVLAAKQVCHPHISFFLVLYM